MSTVKRMHAMTNGYLNALMALAALAGFSVAMALVTTWPNLALRADRALTVAQAPTEDSPGWDCLRQGNVTCSVDGVLVTSLVGLPDDPYRRCVFLLDISTRLDPDYDTRADMVCQAYAPSPDMP